MFPFAMIVSLALEYAPSVLRLVQEIEQAFAGAKNGPAKKQAAMDTTAMVLKVTDQAHPGLLTDAHKTFFQNAVGDLVDAIVAGLNASGGWWPKAVTAATVLAKDAAAQIELGNTIPGTEGTDTVSPPDSRVR